MAYPRPTPEYFGATSEERRQGSWLTIRDFYLSLIDDVVETPCMWTWTRRPGRLPASWLIFSPAVAQWGDEISPDRRSPCPCFLRQPPRTLTSGLKTWKAPGAAVGEGAQ